MNDSAPYRTTPVFDQDSLPAALRRSHSTKAGVWGRLCVLEGAVRYVIADCGSPTIASAGQAIVILPEQMHFVEPLGNMRMCVEFYDHLPGVAG